jgi:nitrite reductase/ring-hydroxylating ferredoxin subunit
MFGPAHNLSDSTLPRECSYPEERWKRLASLWLPAAAAADIGDRPLGVLILDQRVVLWRTRSGLSAARDICIHRGSQLSFGSVKGDELVCAYHGFRYDSSGRCTLAPCTGSSETRLPAKLHLSNYASREAGGLLWVRMSLEGAPEPPDARAPADAGIESVEWRTSAERAMEYLLDPGSDPFGNAAAGMPLCDRPGKGPPARLNGPYSGFWDNGTGAPGSGSFAVLPVSIASCRLFVAAGRADARALAAGLATAQPIVESLPVGDSAPDETLLPRDGTIVEYRERLAALQLA